MGIKSGLFELFNFVQNTNEVNGYRGTPIIKQPWLESYRHAILIVDAFFLLWRYIIETNNARSEIVKKINANEQIKKQNKLTSEELRYIDDEIMRLKHELQQKKYKPHLYAIARFVSICKAYDMHPIFVFDGKPPESKHEVLDDRRKKRNLTLTPTHNDTKVMTSDDNNLNHIKIDECKALLNALGVPYVQAPQESDSECAFLSHINGGREIYVVSNDMDCLPFGCNRLLKDFKRRDYPVQEITLSAIIEQLDCYAKHYYYGFCEKLDIPTFNQINFIELCVMLGCDYCLPKLDLNEEGIKPSVSILNLYIRCGLSLENVATYVCEQHKTKTPMTKEELLKQWEITRDTYKITQIVTDIDTTEYEPDIDKVEQILKENYFNDDLIVNILNPVKRNKLEHSKKSWRKDNRVLSDSDVEKLIHCDCSRQLALVRSKSIPTIRNQ